MQRVKGTESYFVHKDLYKTLARIRAREMARGAEHARLAGSRQAGFGGAISEQQLALTDQTQKAAVKPNEEDERVRAMAALIDPLGVDAETYFMLDGQVLRTAGQASEDFYALRRTQRGLDHYLAQGDDEAHREVDRAFSREDQALRPGDGWKQRILNAAAEDLEQNWGIVMLLPNGPYERALGGLVEQLEPDNANEILAGDEKLLLATAQSLLNGLQSNPRRSSADWMQLQSLFHQLQRVPVQQAGLGDAKRTLN